MLKLGLFIFIIMKMAQAQISFTSLPCSQRIPKIVGGTEASRHELPYMVSLVRRGGHICGGTIIHERWIVTAGHCICNGLNKFMKPAQLQGLIGLHSINEYMNNIDAQPEATAVLVHFKNIVPHPLYECTNVKNDIALLELLAPMQFNKYIQPTCLTLDTGLHENEYATVSGWGWTDENQELGQRADKLRKASVMIWNNRMCEQSYKVNGKLNTISETQLCAGYENGGIDSCWADSGGPLISNENMLLGVVSTGIGCARPGLPGIYTRVSKYVTWMENVILQR